MTEPKPIGDELADLDTALAEISDELNATVAETRADWLAVDGADIVSTALTVHVRNAAERMWDLLGRLPTHTEQTREKVRAARFAVTHLMGQNLRRVAAVRTLYQQLAHALAVAKTLIDEAAEPIDPLDVSDCERAGRVVFVWDGHLVTASLSDLSLDNRSQLIVNATHPVTWHSEHKWLQCTAVVALPPDLPQPACPACPTTTHGPVERTHPTAHDLMDRITTALTYLTDNEDGSFTETVIEILRGERTTES